MTERLTALAPTPLRDFEIRFAGAKELPFIMHSWEQSHMRSPGQPFAAAYKKHVSPTLDRLMKRSDVWTVAAFGEFDGRPDAILAWLAWTPGDLPTIHYAFTRGGLRGRGYFNALLEHENLGRRWLYTHKGQLPKYRRKNGPTYDKKVLAALARRGIVGTYVDVHEWLERMDRK